MMGGFKKSERSSEVIRSGILLFFHFALYLSPSHPLPLHYTLSLTHTPIPPHPITHFPSLSLALSHTHLRAHTLAHTYTCTHAHTHTLRHTHTLHTLTHSITHRFTHTYSPHSVSPFTHAQTHTHTHTHTHTFIRGTGARAKRLVER